MAPNTSKCNHLTPLRFKGLTNSRSLSGRKRKSEQQGAAGTTHGRPRRWLCRWRGRRRWWHGRSRRRRRPAPLGWSPENIRRSPGWTRWRDGQAPTPGPPCPWATRSPVPGRRTRLPWTRTSRPRAPRTAGSVARIWEADRWSASPPSAPRSSPDATPTVFKLWKYNKHKQINADSVWTKFAQF